MIPSYLMNDYHYQRKEVDRLKAENEDLWKVLNYIEKAYESGGIFAVIEELKQKYGRAK